MSDYWIKRQNNITKKNVKETEKHLKKYYKKTFSKVLDEFEKTYTKIFEDIKAGNSFSPANLYKLDTYWIYQNQLTKELQKLGDKQILLLHDQFIKECFEIYDAFSLKGEVAFSTLDESLAQAMIKEIWCADGKSWSDRVWGNSRKLQQALDDRLISCAIAGTPVGEVKKYLMEEFDQNYSMADRVVRTEMANIQTKAAKKRYLDYGIEYYEILGNEDDTCGNHSVDCHNMDGKRFKLSEMRVGVNAPPFHPNCKCTIIPVI